MLYVPEPPPQPKTAVAVPSLVQSWSARIELLYQYVAMPVSQFPLRVGLSV